VASQLKALPGALHRQPGRVAHECILDIRPIKAATGISEVDIAKRLMDYGFHAPTMSFPVAGTIMVEPTESGRQGRAGPLHRRHGEHPQRDPRHRRRPHSGDNNPLKNAPTPRPTSWATGTALFPPGSRLPLAWVGDNKFWPSVNRIDDVYGDRNLFCSCVPMDELG
jgi:glycine dehydrogenase